MLRKLLLVWLLFHSFSLLFSQETFPVNGVHNKNHNYYAFTNATIFVDYQTKIEKATLLIKEGAVVEVGDKVKIPVGTVVTDLQGKYIYPSFIDLFTSYGLAQSKGGQKQGYHGQPQMESNKKGAYNWNQAIHPEVNAVDDFNADEVIAEGLRKLGFGVVLSGQMDGIARGSAAMVALANINENNAIVKDKVAALYSFNKGSSTQDYPSSLMGSIALLRQTFLDAQWYSRYKDKEFNISLECFNNLSLLPQIFDVKDKFSALRADKLGDEYGVQFIIKGSGDEYQRIAEIKATNAKFILPLNFPEAYDVEDPYDAALVSIDDMKHWELAPINLFAFEKNFIPFALTTSGLKDINDFKANLRKAIKYGLSEKQALRALTYTPAEMMNLTNVIGKLEKGKLANFIICSGNVFEKETILFENWVKGYRYTINDMSKPDIRGEYELTVGSSKFSLKIKGEQFSPKATISFSDTLKQQADISVNGKIVTLSFSMKEVPGIIRLSGAIEGVNMSGKGQWKQGEWVDWNAVFKQALPAGKKDSITEVPLTVSLDDVIFPFSAYGKKYKDESLKEKFKSRYEAVLIKNVTVWTNEAEGILKDQDVYMTEGRIVSIDDNIQPTKGAFAKVIDGKGKHLTPGIIDEHSHIAIAGGVNEGAQSVTAEVRIGDVINSDDVNIYRQLAGGVVASQLLHGSANPIGGQSAIVKLRWGSTPEEMKIKGADGFIKFALGENVKQSNFGDANVVRFPQTRMGVEQVYFDAFIRAKEYEVRKKNAENDKVKQMSFRRDLELETLVEILNKKRFITCHSYVQSEINMLMHVADSMNFKVNTFTHILEGYKVADKMKAHGAGGSTFADWWAYKYEVYEAIPYNGAILTRMGVTTAFNSDDAEMARRLNQEAAKAVKYGNLSEEEALKLVTINPAKLLHLDNKMGSIRPGKDADVVLWSDNPLSIYAKVEKTLVDGIILFDIDEDIVMREEMAKERARLITKMIEAKKKGEKTRLPEKKEHGLYHCDSEGSFEWY